MELTIPPTLESVSVARDAAAEVVAQLGAADEVVADVRLLVSEACTNAIRAQRRRGVLTPITVDCTVNGDAGVEVEIVVRDGGGGFDTDHLPGAFPDVEAGEGESGYGIPLMLSVASEAEFEHNADGGTTVRLRLRHAADTTRHGLNGER